MDPSMDGSQNQQMLFQQTEFRETGAQVSPGGRWIVYAAEESAIVAHTTLPVEVSS
jgi:hypothetical protein